ncbi:MAG: DUF433 domain-containing protein [Anaerolineae bacterium]|nr:DUF433 domain-containing protein [Anaerolineae bacterium]
MTLEAQAVPLNRDVDDVIRVGNTRVRLDTVVHAFNEGYTAEEIVSQYPALRLADVYATIAYYLNHRGSVDDYLQHRADVAATIRAEIEQKPEYQDFRARLLARRQQHADQRTDD